MSSESKMDLYYVGPQCFWQEVKRLESINSDLSKSNAELRARLQVFETPEVDAALALYDNWSFAKDIQDESVAGEDPDWQALREARDDLSKRILDEARQQIEQLKQERLKLVNENHDLQQDNDHLKYKQGLSKSLEIVGIAAMGVSLIAFAVWDIARLFTK